MGFFNNLFKSKEKRINAQKYKLGMSKTRSGIFSSLKELLETSKEISDELFDELEELFIMADIGVDTVIKFVNHLRDTVELKKLTSPSDLKELIIEEMFKLYVKDEIVSSFKEFQKNIHCKMRE